MSPHRRGWIMKNDGKPGFPPYRTIYDPIISQQKLEQFCSDQGLDIVEILGVGTFRRGHRVAARIITAIVARIISLLSFGQIHDRYADLALIARKQLVGARDVLQRL